ncbi:hypothetical protein AB0B50_20290 [Streptomyces sp. NPDC041068]|uniref:hypothetical protein n=1 Tax=Streptomyces sp. NPDC041068 TaxID=3155130 RepID=UPI0033E297BE
MTDDAVQQEDDQNLWRALYTADGGWSPGVAFADHLSIAAPALAEVDGTLYCAHRGARQGEEKTLPLRWTSFTPASTAPYVTALEQARKPLPDGATEAQTEEWHTELRAASDALTQALKWTPDADAGWIRSAETPALVNDNGTLRMVFTQIRQYGNQIQSSLWETHLEIREGGSRWVRPTAIKMASSEYGQLPFGPALAVFNGAVHLLYANPASHGNGGACLGHLARNAQGEWEPVGVTDEGKTRTPSILPLVFGRKTIVKNGYPGNVALAVHDGQLHVAYRQGVIEEIPLPLLHASFDGSTWTDGQPVAPAPVNGEWDPKTLPYSRRGGALASFGGKLHALYPAKDSDKLRHLTWAKDGGWSAPVELEGHDTNNTPALLAIKEGPEGAEREALLMVHRGIDRYTPPAPPKPPTLDDVTSRDETVHGAAVDDYGVAAWSRVTHRVSATPATLKNGTKALIATWDATAEYYWGFGYYREDGTSRLYGPSITGGTLWLYKGGKFLRGIDFSGGRFDSSGRFRTDVLIPDVEPGTYEVTLSSTNSRKNGGYWWNAQNMARTAPKEYWTEIDLEKSRVTVTITD